MKTKHELENGTVLEVGKTYVNSKFQERTVLFLGKEKVFFKHKESYEESTYYSYCLSSGWKPYEEPKEEVLYEYYMKYEGFPSSQWSITIFSEEVAESFKDAKLQKTGRSFKEVNGVLTEIKE